MKFWNTLNHGTSRQDSVFHHRNRSSSGVLWVDGIGRWAVRRPLSPAYSWNRLLQGAVSSLQVSISNCSSWTIVMYTKLILLYYSTFCCNPGFKITNGVSVLSLGSDLTRLAINERRRIQVQVKLTVLFLHSNNQSHNFIKFHSLSAKRQKNVS